MNSLKFFYNASKPVLELLTSTELFLTFFGIYFKCKRSLFQCAYYRSYEIIIANYFCVCQKNRRKHNQHFKPPFFKINLRFSTPDYIATYGKLNLLSTNGMFLFFPSREVQGRLMQIKVYSKLFLFGLKRSVSQTFNCSSFKKVFPKCVYHWYNWFWWMFFIPCDNCKQYFLHRFIITQRLGATAMLLRSFKQVFWKKSAFYIHYLHNNITMMLILKVQNKASTSQKTYLLIAFPLHSLILQMFHTLI